MLSHRRAAVSGAVRAFCGLPHPRRPTPPHARVGFARRVGGVCDLLPARLVGRPAGARPAGTAAGGEFHSRAWVWPSPRGPAGCIERVRPRPVGLFGRFARLDTPARVDTSTSLAVVARSDVTTAHARYSPGGAVFSLLDSRVSAPACARHSHSILSHHVRLRPPTMRLSGHAAVHPTDGETRVAACG